MKVETVEEFLARGGKVQKSSDTKTLEEVLYNEGLLDAKEAQAAKKDLANALGAELSKQFSKGENNDK